MFASGLFASCMNVPRVEGGEGRVLVFPYRGPRRCNRKVQTARRLRPPRRQGSAGPALSPIDELLCKGAAGVPLTDSNAAANDASATKGDGSDPHETAGTSDQNDKDIISPAASSEASGESGSAKARDEFLPGQYVWYFSSHGSWLFAKVLSRPERVYAGGFVGKAKQYVETIDLDVKPRAKLCHVYPGNAAPPPPPAGTVPLVVRGARKMEVNTADACTQTEMKEDSMGGRNNVVVTEDEKEEEKEEEESGEASAYDEKLAAGVGGGCFAGFRKRFKKRR